MKNMPLVDPQKVYLSPFHIKLGLMKNFVKGLKKDSNGFQYVKKKFEVEKSDAKLKGGVFVGLEIRELMLDDEFKTQLHPVELAAWEAFISLVQNFLGS